MICLISPVNDPYFNLAAEEYFLREFKEDIVFLYVNEPCVVVGKHQNAMAECDYYYLHKNKIPLVRRLSGGGTVFHDGGNINFCLIRNFEDRGKSVAFREFLKPVMDYLHTKNVPAEFSDRNDLLVEGKKFSGNAEHVFQQGKRTLHHGTILFDSRLDSLMDSLKANLDRYEHKGVQSVRSAVTNINKYLTSGTRLSEFLEEMLDHMCQLYGVMPYRFTDRDIQAINELKDTKYSTWEWNIARSPKYRVNEKFDFDGKIFHLTANIEKGIIVYFNLKLEGDQLVFSGELLNERLVWDELYSLMIENNVRPVLCEAILRRLF